jgi:ABC-type oligopeptide transport system substrate-binding subunit
LTALDLNQRPVPALAQRWEIADAGRTYTFHLRTARYQSGATVQAQDALTAWTRALDPAAASPNTIFFAALGARYPGDKLTSVEVVDSTTLRLRLPRADSELLTLLALPPYWLADPKPSVRTVDIEIEPDNVKRLDRFTSGGVDIAHGFTGPQLLAFARDPQQAAELHKVPNTRTTWLGFNTVAGSGYGPPDRLAIAQAIDRSRVTDLALFGSMLAAPATDLLSPGLPGHLNRQLPAYDPAAARNALDQAGFGPKIDLYFSTNSTVGRVATDLQDQLSAATGRTVVLHPTGDFFNQAALDKLPFFIDTWSADVPYPSDFLENVLRASSQFNNLRLFDSDMEHALDQGRAALTWDDAIKGYQQAEGLALAQNRLIPLYSGVEPYLVRPSLHVPFSGGTIPYRWENVR